MMKHDSPTQGMTTKSMFLTFLAGATAGAVAGLLLAPQSGRESRKQFGACLSKAGKTCKAFVEKSRSLVNKQYDEENRETNQVIPADREGMQGKQKLKEAS